MEQKTKHLVLGMGEVGQAIATILECEGVDKDVPIPCADVLHVCIPFSDVFVQTVQSAQETAKANLIIIHSTVPLGTTKKCGEDAVHSPIRGKHPNLTQSLKTFVKFFGGTKSEEASRYFSTLGISVLCSSDSENTEAMKLWDTEIYREAILLNKKIYEYCQTHGLDFDVVYTKANETYNTGYQSLGHPEYVKYTLKYVQGPIGGHCVEPNHQLLSTSGA